MEQRPSQVGWWPWTWSPMIWAMVYALLMPLFIAAAANWSQMPAVVRGLGGQTAAAWVQAIGTIGAIAGALYAARRQSEHAVGLEERRRSQAIQEETERSRERYKAGRRALVVASDVTRNVLREYKAITDSATFRPAKPLTWVLNAQDLLAYFSALEHQSLPLVFALFAAQRDLPRLRAALEGYDGSGGAWAAFGDAAIDAERAVRETLDELDNGIPDI